MTDKCACGYLYESHSTEQKLECEVIRLKDSNDFYFRTNQEQKQEIKNHQEYITWLEKELMYYSLNTHNKSSLESIRLAYERRNKV